MTQNNRKGESGKVPERNGRFVSKDGYWYYQTREGVDIGPFDTRGEAETGVGDFIDYICASAPDAAKVIKRYCAA